MALDDLAFLSSSLTILVRASYLMLESTLSSVTTFYQVPCGFYGFQLTLHASIPSRQGSVPAGGLHVPGRRQSFCTYWGNEFAFLPSALLFLPVVSLADLHDMYSEGHSCFCTQWRSPQILFLCQWVCLCCLRACWRYLYFIIFAGFLLLMEPPGLWLLWLNMWSWWWNGCFSLWWQVAALRLLLTFKVQYLIYLNFSSRHSVGRQGLTQSGNGSRATEGFGWVSINGKNLFLVMCLFFTNFDLSGETGHPTVPILSKRKAPFPQININL